MLRIFGALLAALALCAAAQAQVTLNTPLGTIGAPHDKILTEFLDKNQPEEAARYWGENRSWFWDNAAQHKELLARLKSAVNTPHEARMGPAEEALKPFAAEARPIADWAAVIRALAEARFALGAYRQLPIAVDDSLRSERFVSLDAIVATVTDVYVKSAPQAFAEYEHFANPPFAKAYPVEVPDDVVAEGYPALKPKLETAKGEQIALFSEVYAKALSPVQRDELARYAGAARYRELMPDGKPTVEGMQKLIAEISAGRLQLAALPVKLGFFWSPEAAKAGEFAVALNAPQTLPFREVRRRDLPMQLADRDVALFIDTDRTATSRNTRTTRQEHSSYKSSQRQVLNPAYLDAQALVQQKQLDQVRAESGGGFSFSLDPISLVAGLAKEAYTQTKTFAAKANLKQAQDQLAATPRTVAEDVIGDYRYEVTDVEVTRRMPFALYIIDVKNATYLKQATEVTERKRFEAADGLHPKDPERDQLAARYASPKALADYVESPASVEAGMLITTAFNVMNDANARPIAGLAQDVERGAQQAPTALLAALAAPAGSCDVFFENFMDQLKAARQCAADPESAKGVVERVAGQGVSVAETGILSAARTPELYKMVPANDERWLAMGDSAQPNCAAPIAVRNPQDQYIECVRVLSCGARTAACGREITRQNRGMACPEAAQRCMVVYPVPQ
jgi:hypothetical protein